MVARRRRPFGVVQYREVFLLAACYFGLAQLANSFSTGTWNSSVFWPAMGLAVGVVYRRGWSLLPGVFVGSFAAHGFHAGWWAAAGLGAATTIGVAFAVRLLHKFQPNPDFVTLGDLRSLMIAAASGSFLTALSAAPCYLLLNTFREKALFATVVNIWMGHLLGIAIVAPLIMGWSAKLLPRYSRRGLTRGLACISFATLVLTVVVFSAPIPYGAWTMPAAFLAVLCVAWAATIGRTWPAMIQVAIVALGAVYANDRVTGACFYLDPTVRESTVWGYLMSLATIALGLSGLLSTRDEVERQLRSSEETYRAIVHDNPALICQFRTDGTLVVVNETFRRAFRENAVKSELWDTHLGQNKHDPKRNFYTLVGLTGDAKTLARIRSWDTPDEPIVFDTCTEPKDGGTIRWYRWTARAVDMSSTIITEYHAVGLEISNEKRAEAERKTLEAQAIQTQQYEAIGVLAGGIAHEFNNILTSGIGYTELALSYLDKNHRVVPMLEEILSGSMRAADLTKQLMIYGGQSHTHPRSFDISQMIRDSQGLLAVVLQKSTRLRFELATQAAEVFADESKLRQLLVCLVTNSAESFARGTVGEVVVRTSSEYVDNNGPKKKWTNGAKLVKGHYVELEVRDNGSGMSAETLARVFEPFFTTKFPGRGLGMAAVLGIVHDHRGAIQIRSDLGQGTTVRVLIPSTSSVLADDSMTPIPVGSRRSASILQSELVRT